MILVKKGKTKDVYQNEDGTLELLFKDDVTGTDGVFDPGANTVGLTLSGIGKQNLKLSKYLFEMLKNNGVVSHYVDCDVENATMTVLPATMFGHGVEVICRFVATGSFIRRYGDYVTDGTILPAYVEITLKDDERNDPLITKEGLEVLEIMTGDEYHDLVPKTQDISKQIKNEFSNYGLDLLDIKLEFGRNQNTGEIMLIDELSSGNMRVSENGTVLKPFELIERVLNK